MLLHLFCIHKIRVLVESRMIRHCPILKSNIKHRDKVKIRRWEDRKLRKAEMWYDSTQKKLKDKEVILKNRIAHSGAISKARAS